jgi:hypothetical protein
MGVGVPPPYWLPGTIAAGLVKLCVELRGGLQRQFFRGGEMVLLAANFAVILGGHFEKLIASVGCKLTALVPQLFQFSVRERLKIRGDGEVLIQNLHRVDSADRRGDRQTHGIPQSLLSRDASAGGAP